MTLFISTVISELDMLAASDSDFKATAVFDEFHRIASAGRKDEQGLSSTGQVAKTGRKRQFQIIGLEQNLSLVEPAITGNIDVFGAFRTRDPKDRYAAARMHNLDQEQSDTLGILKPREYVFICGCLDEAVLLKTPEMRVRDLSREAEEMSGAFVKNYHQMFEAQSIAAGTAERPHQTDEYLEDEGTTEPRPKDSSKICARVVALNPFLKQKEYFALWGLSVGAGKKMWDELVRFGLCVEKVANPGGAGGTFKSLWPTEKGLSFAGLEGRFQRPKGKGDWEHVCYQHLVAKCLRATGADAVVEGDISGKNVDVKVVRHGRVEACEIEMRVTAQSVKNVVDDLERGADSVTVLVRRKADMEEAREKLGQHEAKTGRPVFGGRVTIGYLREHI